MRTIRPFRRTQRRRAIVAVAEHVIVLGLAAITLAGVVLVATSLLPRPVRATGPDASFIEAYNDVRGRFVFRPDWLTGGNAFKVLDGDRMVGDCEDFALTVYCHAPELPAELVLQENHDLLGKWVHMLLLTEKGQVWYLADRTETRAKLREFPSRGAALAAASRVPLAQTTLYVAELSPEVCTMTSDGIKAALEWTAWEVE